MLTDKQIPKLIKTLLFLFIKMQRPCKLHLCFHEIIYYVINRILYLQIINIEIGWFKQIFFSFIMTWQ